MKKLLNWINTTDTEEFDDSFVVLVFVAGVCVILYWLDKIL